MLSHKYLSLFLFFGVCHTPVSAQDIALGVCKSLAENRLIDRFDESSSGLIAQREFDLFCSDSGSYSSSFAKKSSGFRASFADAATKVGLGSRSNRSAGFEQSDFEKMCEIGANDFVRSYQTEASQEVGANLAAIVSDCVNNVISTEADWVYGTASFTADGQYFLAQIDRKAPNTAPNLQLVAIDPPGYFSGCKSGTENAIGKRLVNNMSLSCNLSETVPDGGIQGFLYFQDPATDEAQSVSFDVRRNGFVRQSEAEAMVEIKTSDLAGRISDMDNDIAKLKKASVCAAQHLASYQSRLPEVWENWIGIAGIYGNHQNRNDHIDTFMTGTDHPSVRVPHTRLQLEADLDLLNELIAGDEPC